MVSFYLSMNVISVTLSIVVQHLAQTSIVKHPTWYQNTLYDIKIPYMISNTLYDIKIVYYIKISDMISKHSIW